MLSLRFLVAGLCLGCGQVASTPDAASDASLDAHGDAPLGAPCSSDDQCQGSLCLGFAGGYCSTHVAECDPGGSTSCGDAGDCRKTGATDVDGGAIGEFCLAYCATQADCREGYACCAAQEYALDASVCAPQALCRDM